MKHAFIIAIVAVAMIGVMVPSGFAEILLPSGVIYDINTQRLKEIPTFCIIGPENFSEYEKTLYTSLAQQGVGEWDRALQYSGVGGKFASDDMTVTEAQGKWKINSKIISSYDSQDDCTIVLSFHETVGTESHPNAIGWFKPASQSITIAIKNRTMDQIYDTITHEIGHAFGLGHYYTMDKEKLNGWISGKIPQPSIMVPTANRVPSQEYIEDVDVQMLISLYGSKGFTAFSPQISQIPLPEPTVKPIIPIFPFDNIQIKNDVVLKKYESTYSKITGQVKESEFFKGHQVVITIIKSDDTWNVHKITPTKSGYFELPLIFDKNSPTGYYTLTASYLDHTDTSMNFTFLVDFKNNSSTINCGTGTELINGICKVIPIEDEITSKLVNCDDKMLKIISERDYSDQRNLSGSILINCNLETYGFSYWNLQDVDFSGANLKGADFFDADLSGADLSGADLSGADLSGADLSGADLSRTNLSYADLSGANLEGAILRNANLDGANLSGADLTNTQLESQNEKLIDQEQLEELFLEKYTLLDSIKSDFQKLVDEQKLLKQKLENVPSDSNQNKVNNEWDELKENQKQIDRLESLIKTTEGTLNAGRGAEKYFELMDEKQISIISKIKWIKVGIDGVDGWGPQEDETDRIYKTPEGNYEYEKISDREEGGGCLIATATYGSELAPQVQQLRELRDNQLLQTSSGTAFISTFNDIYYSFSPIVADYERENPVFKEAVKFAITPMISSLSLMDNAETESEVISLGLSVIMLNIGMYLGVPAVVIVGIKRRF